MFKRKTKKKPVAKKTVTKTITTTTTTTVVTGSLKNRIGIIIDASGSMASLREEIVKAFNGQVDTIQANNKDMDTRVSLLTFSDVPHSYKVLDQSTDHLNKIQVSDYNPSGGTALYDSVGKMVTYFENLPEAKDPTCSFLLVILTDGHENASREWTFGRVREKIQSLEATGRWTFSYLGAAEGLTDVGVGLGMSAGNTVSGSQFRMSGVYASTASSSMKGFLRTRGMGGQSVTNFYSGASGTGETDPVDPNDPNAVKVTTTTTVTKPKTKAGQS